MTAVAVVGIGTLIGPTSPTTRQSPPADASAWDGGQPTGDVRALRRSSRWRWSPAPPTTAPAASCRPCSGRRAGASCSPPGSASSSSRPPLLGRAAGGGGERRGAGVPAPSSGSRWVTARRSLGGLAFVFATRRAARRRPGARPAQHRRRPGDRHRARARAARPCWPSSPTTGPSTSPPGMPGSGALFLIFGEGPSDDMTTASARLTLAVWAARRPARRAAGA